MNIGFAQILLVLFVCFLLFGNLANLISNIKTFLENFKKFK